MSLTNQSSFIERTKSELSATIDAIHNHEYIHSLEKHEIRKEKLEIFICEQYHIITNDMIYDSYYFPWLSEYLLILRYNDYIYKYAMTLKRSGQPLTILASSRLLPIQSVTQSLQKQ